MVAEKQDWVEPRRTGDWPVLGSPQDTMRNRFARETLPWLVGGVLFVALLLVLVWHFQGETSPSRQLVAQASRADLVSRMQADLASASEAEKSAVLAITDRDSQTFADQARAATARVETELQELGHQLPTEGAQREGELMAQFSEAFRNLKAIDEEVLTLAVKNTNLKAYGLLFGDAANTLAQMDAALARVIEKRTEAPDAKRVLLLASDARIGVLRVQALLAPHIAEESDEKMDQMEVAMSKEEAQVRKGLDGLAALQKPAADADLGAARAAFARYEEIKARIVVLSRENTNVRSLAMSLNQKRNALAICLEDLGALKASILDERIVGADRPPKPR
jgi:hypothetical protein